MSDPEGRSPPPDPSPRRRRRRLARWRVRLIRWLEGPHEGPPPASPSPPSAEGAPPPEPQAQPLDLVDQAEAFATLRVSDVMTPRADVAALDISTPLDEVVARFVSSELTRLPVYRDSLDDPVGVVHIKDVVKLLAPHEPGAGPPWKEPILHRLRREVLYVPASMRTADLLVRMRAQRIHMALVIDEFGGTDGLVTLEDLIEAVVGEIDDEHDVAEPPDLIERPGGIVEADARTPLEDLERRLGVGLQPDVEEEDLAQTVGGLVTALAGRLPQRGEVIVHPAGVEFEVIDADPRRIRRLRVRETTKAIPLDLAQPADDEAAAFLPDESQG